MTGAFGMRTALVCGLLWGVGVTLADTLTEPVIGLTLDEWLYFTLGTLWQWIAVGMIWTVGTHRLAQGRWRAVKIALLLPLSLGAAVILQWLSPFPKGQDTGEISIPLVGSYTVSDLTMYLLWHNAFFGGLYVTGYLATRRISRAGKRLAKFQLARNDADFQAREAQVNAYRGQLQPSMLLAAIAALRDRYVSDPEGGDELFDSLIAFLRAAMPSVRSGISTLATELDTVRNYAALRGMLAVPEPRWQLHLATALPLPPLPFPSLILLPAMHGLGAELRQTDVLTLSVEAAPDQVRLRLAADRAIELPHPIDRRLRGGLRLTFGSAAWVSEGRSLPLTIRLFPQQVEAFNAILEGDSNETDGHYGNRGAGNVFLSPDR